MVAMASWVSVPVRPCPGKCLVHAATPAPCRPATAAAVCRDTRPVSAPKDRVPTAGLSAEPSTSAHGARSKLIPSAARSAPIAWYTDLGQGGVVHRAESGVARVRAAVGVRDPGDVAALLVDRDHRVVSREPPTRSAAVSALTWSGSRDVLAEEGDAGQAPAERVEHPARSGGAGERRDEDRVGQPAQHRVRGPDVGVLAHPFTAPATRPLAMRRCTMRKKTITGIVNRVEEAMIDPQSTVPRP